jgi:hypothetical protein
MKRDASKPRGEPCTTRELTQMRVRSEPRLLCDVLRLAVASKHGTHEPIDALIVAAHEDFEEIGLARAHSTDDLFVGEDIPLL